MSSNKAMSDSPRVSPDEGLRHRRIVGGSRTTSSTNNSAKRNDEQSSFQQVGTMQATKSTNKAKGPKKRQGDSKSKWPIVFICGVYVPLLAVFNPLTITKWYYMLNFYYFSKNPNIETDAAKSLSFGNSHDCDALTNITRLIFVRIPKTASTSIMDVFFQQQTLMKNKDVASATHTPSSAKFVQPLSILDVGELEGDIVSSIPVDMKNATQKRYLQQNVQGFYDASSHGTLHRRRQFYGKMAKQLLYPPPASFQKPTLFQGHLHFIDDWPSMTEMFYPNTTSTSILHSLLPDWLQEAYSINYPSKEEMANVRQFTFMRNPLERYSSMYHYDRHATRTPLWRQQYVEKFFGNVTLNECLKVQECIEQNKIQRWCNLQTQVLCGMSKDCDDPSSPEAFEKAKKRITSVVEDKTNMDVHASPSPLIMVGITERLEESLELLSHLVPTYLYFEQRQQGNGDDKISSISSLPRTRVSKSKEVLTTSSIKVLERLCQNDLKLYDLANDLLEKKTQTCRIQRKTS